MVLPCRAVGFVLLSLRGGAMIVCCLIMVARGRSGADGAGPVCRDPASGVSMVEKGRPFGARFEPANRSDAQKGGPFPARAASPRVGSPISAQQGPLAFVGAMAHPRRIATACSGARSPDVALSTQTVGHPLHAGSQRGALARARPAVKHAWAAVRFERCPVRRGLLCANSRPVALNLYCDPAP